MSNLILSINVAVYGQERTIVRCLDSIYSQGVDESLFEVVCIDDNSPDKVLECVKEYAKGNIRLIEHEINKGIAAVRNTGIQNSRGEYIMYLDGDDELCEKSLHVLIDACRTGNDIVAFDYVQNGETSLHYAHNSTIPMKGAEYILTQSIPSQPWAMIYRRSFLCENHLSYSEGAIFEDVDFVWRSVYCAKSISYMKHAVYRYYRYEDSACHARMDSKRVEHLLKMYDRIAHYSQKIAEPKVKQAFLYRAFYGYGTAYAHYSGHLTMRERARLLSSYKAPLPVCGKEEGAKWKVNWRNKMEAVAYLSVAYPPLLNVMLHLYHHLRQLLVWHK